MTSLATANHTGHAAAEAAGAHAERAQAGWKEDAYRALVAYPARQGGREFLAEDVRAFAIELGLAADPVELRAWGHALLRAKREGVITPAGYRSAASSNGGPKVLWKAALRLT